MQITKKTLILGATSSAEKYAYKAAEKLVSSGYGIVPVGIREGTVFGRKILNSRDLQPEIDTITIYLSPQNQIEWYDYIINTKPRRIIFNPGTENLDLAQLAHEHNIATENACTLVLLGTNQY
ncbi:MAG: CoA-binding protein [Cytophagales bacterium]